MRLPPHYGMGMPMAPPKIRFRLTTHRVGAELAAQDVMGLPAGTEWAPHSVTPIGGDHVCILWVGTTWPQGEGTP